MDHRDVVGHYRPVLQDVDQKRMTALFIEENAQGEEVAHTLTLQFEVCPTCDGKGSHTNPSIDSHGLSQEDFDDDPDFAESYRSGAYDVVCCECHGERVVPVVDELRNDAGIVARYHEAVMEAWRDAQSDVREREMGY